MPYLMGGFPSLEESRAIGEACLRQRRRPARARRPVLRPAGRRAGHPGRGHAGAARGRDARRRARGGRGAGARAPVVLMAYANLILARGAERLAGELAERGIAGLIVPDLPLEEAGERARRLRRRGRRARPAGRADHARRAPARASGRGRAASSTPSRSRARPASAPRWPSASPRSSGARRRTTDVPVALGFGISTPEQAAQAAAAGADGVIVGSRLVAPPARAAPTAVGQARRPSSPTG